MKVQIIENENFINNANFENCEVWLLNRTNSEELDERVINISEITESMLPTCIKFPKLFTEISNKYFLAGIIPDDFEYEIITDSSEKYMVHSYVCDVENIRIISSN